MTAETTTAAGVAIVDAAALALALKTIKPAITKLGGLPVLAHVHLQGNGERLTVEATNLELGLTATLDALTDGPLDVCLPFAALVKLIDPERSGDVTITAEEPGKTSVSQGKRTARIETLAGADFPVLAYPTGATPDVALTAGAWSRVRASLLPAAADDAERPVLQGVYVACEPDGAVTLVAADGFRLATYAAGMAPAPFTGYIIPRASLAAIPAKVAVTISGATDGNGQTRAYFGYTVASKAATLAMRGLSRTIDGHFPDVRHIIPRIPHETPHAFRVEVSAIREARDFRPGNDTIRITADSVSCIAAGVGDITWNGTTVAYEGDGTMAAGFAIAARYADWAADAAGDGTHVTFQASAPHSPLVAERAGLLCLVMPMVLS